MLSSLVSLLDARRRSRRSAHGAVLLCFSDHGVLQIVAGLRGRFVVVTGGVCARLVEARRSR